MGFVDEVASGDERRALEAMRDALAAHMEQADSNVVAQVAARLQAVVKRLAELGSQPTEGSATDEIARKRAARRAAAQVAQAAAGSDD
jgi:hypothetical protein